MGTGNMTRIVGLSIGLETVQTKDMTNVVRQFAAPQGRGQCL